MASTSSSQGISPARRTQIVWGSFLVAVVLVVGLLSLGRPGDASAGGYLMTNVSVLGEPPSGPDDPVFRTDRPLDTDRWTSIVIHHSGAPAGDAESIRRLHESYGYHGLGYHFLVGNGNGLGDGVVHVGYRWTGQLPGVHTSGPQADHYNQHAIGICLIGHGDRRAFSERQLASLLSLVQRLQRELDIPADRVHLQRDLDPATTGPGRFFAAGRLDEAIRRRR